MTAKEEKKYTVQTRSLAAKFMFKNAESTNN